jgi:chromosome transmission fidelity protein 4
VTLKLFNEIIKAGKVERALSLVHRLHLEKSYDIAIQVSDRMGHRKLSDFIEDSKLQRFPAVEDDLFDHSNSIGSRQKSFDEASITSDREDQRDVRGISPEIHTPKGRHSREVQSELTDEESPPRSRVSLKRQLEDDRVLPQTKRPNPFTKVSVITCIEAITSATKHEI